MVGRPRTLGSSTGLVPLNLKPLFYFEIRANLQSSNLPRLWYFKGWLPLWPVIKRRVKFPLIPICNFDGAQTTRLLSKPVSQQAAASLLDCSATILLLKRIVQAGLLLVSTGLKDGLLS